MHRFRPLNPNETFGPYTLTHLVKESGQLGEIYRATHHGVEGFEKTLALKKTHADFSRNEAFWSALVANIAQAVKLHHANIVQVLDLGQVEGCYYLTTEFVSGVDLGLTLERCRQTGCGMPQPLVLMLAIESIKALDYAHRRKNRQLQRLNFCHGGLHPGNILLSWDGEIKVTDFGIQRSFSALNQQQRPSLGWRSRYQAPELLRGEVPSAQSDIYALGTLLYESLTGMHPLEPESKPGVRTGVFPAVAEIAEVHPEFSNIIERMLSPTREERFSDIAQLYDPLLSLSAQEGLRANARHLADWVQSVLQAADSERERSTDDLPVRTGVLSAIEGVAEESPIEASGLWTISAHQQRDFLELPIRHAPAGTEPIIKALRQDYVEVQRSGGRAVMLFGEPGCGKSFMLRYALGLFAEAGSACHTAYLPEVAQSAPFSVVQAWLASAAGLSPIDTPRVRETKLQVLASSLDLTTEEIELVAYLFGVGKTQGGGITLLGEMLLGVIIKLVEKLSKLGPVLLTVDNCQFADRASFLFLKQLLERLESQQLLLVLASSDPQLADYLKHTLLRQIELHEPDDELLQQIIAEHLPEPDISPMTRAYLASTPEPLSRILEIVDLSRSMVRVGYELDQALQLMLSFEASRRLATTLHTLKPPEIQVLQWLSAAIEPLHVLHLKQLVSLPPAMLHSVLQSLLTSRLVIYAAPSCLALANSELGPTMRSLYDHGLIAQLHQHLAATISAQVGADLSTQRPHIQALFALSGDIKGLSALAAEHAQLLANRGFSEISVVHLEQAVEHLVISGVEAPRVKGGLHRLIARYGMPLLMLEKAKHNLSFSQRTPGLQSDPIGFFEQRSLEVEIRLEEENYGESRQILEQLQHMVGDEHLQASLLPDYLICCLRFVLSYGDIHFGLEVLKGVSSTLIQRHPLLLALAGRLWIHAGRVDEARPLLDLTPKETLWGEKGASINFAQGLLYSELGHQKQARRHLEAAFDACQREGLRRLGYVTIPYWVDYLVARGRSQRARKVIAMVLENKPAATPRVVRELELSHHYLAAAYRGEKESLDQLELRLEEAIDRGIPAEIVRATSLVGDAMERQGNPKLASRAVKIGADTRRRYGIVNSGFKV